MSSLTCGSRVVICTSTSSAPTTQRLVPPLPHTQSLSPKSWHMIGRTSPQATSGSSVSPRPHSSTAAMEAREGRSGNAFACERCKETSHFHAPVLTSKGRKHKVRCVPSDTASVCQRYVFPVLFRHLGVTRASDVRKHASNASNTSHAEDQQNPG